jgi:hypothetical protein
VEHGATDRRQGLDERAGRVIGRPDDPGVRAGGGHLEWWRRLADPTGPRSQCRRLRRTDRSIVVAYDANVRVISVSGFLGAGRAGVLGGELPHDIEGVVVRLDGAPGCLLPAESHSRTSHSEHRHWSELRPWSHFGLYPPSDP